jgi:acylphosphatase
METKAYRVSGRVQGVGYRYFVLQRARGLGLKGFVKNLPDGDVFVQVWGSPEKIAGMVEELRKGPSFAFVRKVEAVSPEETGTFPDFRIRY